MKISMLTRYFSSQVFLFFLLNVINIQVWCQIPQGIPYQAAIRDNLGNPILNTAVTIQFSLHQNDVSGPIEYQETQSLTTNNFGLISTNFGQGTAIQGSFVDINWSSTMKFIQIEANSGSGFVDMGTQQMMSVPYAFHSNSAENAVNAQNSGNGFSHVSSNGDTLYFNNGNFIIIPGLSSANPSSLSGLGSEVLPGNSTCEAQSISITGCGGQTTLMYDGREYDLVEINGQCWFAENLATDQYRNGDLISSDLYGAQELNNFEGAYGYLMDNPTNDAIYGKLYNAYAVISSKGLCPAGWHVPSDCDWMYLENSLGMTLFDQQQIGVPNRGSVGGELKSVIGWQSGGWLPPNEGATNSSGFNALPGGIIITNGPPALGIQQDGYWWSSTAQGSDGHFSRHLNYSYTSIFRFSFDNFYGLSVRCLKD